MSNIPIPGQMLNTKTVQLKRKLKGVRAAGKSKMSTVARSNIKKAKTNVKSSLKSFNGNIFADLGREVEDVAMAIALPANSVPQRYSSEFSSLPTAVAAPWSITPAPSIGAAVVTQTQFENMPSTDGFAAVFRSVQRAAVIYDPNPTARAWQLNFNGVSNVTGASLIPATSFTFSCSEVGKLYDLKVPTANASLVYQPHGPVVFAGAVEGSPKRFFWLDNGTLIVNVQGTLADSMNVAITKWDDAGLHEDQLIVNHVMPAGNQAFSFTIAPGQEGYYAMSISDQTVSRVVTVGPIVHSGTSSVFRHLALPNLSSNVGSTDGIRIIGISAMYSNDASPLTKQGKVTGYQVPQGNHWSDYIGNYQTFSSSNGSHTMPVDNGLYGFLKPTQPKDFDLIETLLIETGIVLDSFYPLDQKTSFLMIYWQITNLVGQDGYWTFSYGLEYQSDDVWRTVSSSELSADVYSKALEAIKDFPQFYENPLHWDEVWNNIKSVASQIAAGIAKYGPAVMAVGKVVTGMLG